MGSSEHLAHFTIDESHLLLRVISSFMRRFQSGVCARHHLWIRISITTTDITIKRVQCTCTPALHMHPSVVTCMFYMYVYIFEELCCVLSPS